MARLSAKLRQMTDGGLLWFCPGCKSTHRVPIGPPRGWKWDGNAETPTITPSLRVFITDDEDAEGRKLEKPVERTLCHCNVTAGSIVFHADSPHELSGKTVPMPDWPYAEGEYGGA